MIRAKAALLVLLSGVVFALQGNSDAYVVDGSLSDWGVSLFSDWIPDSDSADWNGGPGEDNFAGAENAFAIGEVGEVFDGEALYFDDDPENLYFAIVTSFPQSGVTPAGQETPVLPGAVSLTVGGKSYALKTDGSNKVFSQPVWQGPGSFTGGSLEGQASLVYQDAGVTENGESTYVIEGSVSKSLVDAPENGSVDVTWNVTSGADELSVHGDLVNPVPEPSSMLLLGTGLAAWAGFRKRKK